MKRLNFMVIGVTILVTLFMACAPREAPAPGRPAAAPIKPREAVKAGWEAEWEKTLKEAQKEGRVTIYVSTPAVALQEGVPIFKKKFGIDLEVTPGRGSDLRGKIGMERAAGLYLADVFIGGLNTHFRVSLPQGFADPMEPELILPEVKSPENWFGGELPWSDKGHRLLPFFYYATQQILLNTDFVKHNDITSYYDLLDPRWKGKIVINDPRVTGSPFNGFSTFLVNKVLDLDFWRQFAKQGPVLDNQQLVTDWVARGKYPIAGIGVPVRHAVPYIEAGVPLEWTDVKEGTYLSVDGSGTIVMNQRPHPNATRVFINWWLGREGQLLAQKVMGYQSARTDIGTEGVGRLNLRQPGVKYYVSANSSEEWVLNEQNKYLKMAQEVFGKR